jgi:hypothetical protein
MAKDFLSTVSPSPPELEHDYLGKLEVDPKDKLDFGVKGMKWGIRKSDSSSSSSTSSTTHPSTHSANETSADRYNRLLSQVKEKGGNSLTDEELRFVNNRGDAIARVQRLSADKPNWIQEAAKDVLQQAAKKTMKTVAANLSKKYIADQLVKSATK